MNGKTRKILMSVLLVILLTAAGLLTGQWLEEHKAAEIYANAQDLANLSKPTIPADTTPATAPTDPAPTTSDTPEETQPADPVDHHAQQLLQWDASQLQQTNPHVIGWIYLPDTAISYPLMHTDNNDTYLYTAWDGTENNAGSIFLETRNSPDLADFNTIIYGHHMRNGSMFAALLDYADPAFRQSHPCVYLATEDTVYRYEIFAAYEAAVTSESYRLIFKDTGEKQVALQSYLNRSVWESSLVPKTSDNILTLSTCTGTGTYDTRWVVQAVRTDSWQKEDAGVPENTGVGDLITAEDPHSEP